VEAMLLILDINGPTMFARIAFMRALNRNAVRELNSDRKERIGKPEIEAGRMKNPPV
jgi:hypothetical protein